MVHRDADYRKKAAFGRVKEYFYGNPGKSDLAPFSITISFNDVLVRVANKGIFIRIYIRLKCSVKCFTTWNGGSSARNRI